MSSEPKISKAVRQRRARAAAARPDAADAFLPDPSVRPEHRALLHTEGEPFAEQFVAAATGGEAVALEAEDEVSDQEWGGPFVEVPVVAESSRGQAAPPSLTAPELPEPSEPSEPYAQDARQPLLRHGRGSSTHRSV